MQWIKPNWPAANSIQAVSSTRIGGTSLAPYDSLNLGSHVFDDAAAVQRNRDIFMTDNLMPCAPQWLNQIHGSNVIVIENTVNTNPTADASITQLNNTVLAVMTADCLPILLCNADGTEIAAIHAGWRSLCQGIIENTLQKMQSPARSILAWLGPCINPINYEVGPEVFEQFYSCYSFVQAYCKPSARPNHYYLDLKGIAIHILKQLKIKDIYKNSQCTFANKDLFFSARRDGVTGRLAHCIWINN